MVDRMCRLARMGNRSGATADRRTGAGSPDAADVARRACRSSRTGRHGHDKAMDVAGVSGLCAGEQHPAAAEPQRLPLGGGGHEGGQGGPAAVAHGLDDAGLHELPSSNVSDNDSYTGTYGVNADLVLYQGGMLRTTVRRQQLQNRIDALTVEEAENDIRLALVEAYMQALYASEAVEIAVSTAEVSRAQRDRAREMWRTGSISKVDFAQIESQYVSDEYQVVVARTTLDNYKLQLKQLLELDITDEMELAAPAAGEDKVVTALPQKTEIYATALEVMPEIRRGDLSIEAAELEVRQARAGFLPSVSLTAGIGTGYMSGGAFESGSQIWNRFNENVGLSLNIPIFSNRKNRTAVNKARISVSNSRLERLNLEKTLLREVETAYLDAVSAQSQYTAAVEKRRYAQESYDLTDEQFRVGMKNTVELITAQNELSSARLEVLQAKYVALLNMALLDIYQGRPVTTI